MTATPRSPDLEVNGVPDAAEKRAAPRRGLAERLVRPVLLILALTTFPVGLWLSISPRSFYDDFPGFGRSWVSVDGPYNEHAFRDFGESQLAIAAMLFAAFLRPHRYVVRSVALAYLLFAVPHLLYHAVNLDVHSTGDQIAIMANLGASVVLPAILVLGSIGEGPPAVATGRTSWQQARTAGPGSDDR